MLFLSLPAARAAATYYCLYHHYRIAAATKPSLPAAYHCFSRTTAYASPYAGDVAPRGMPRGWRTAKLRRHRNQHLLPAVFNSVTGTVTGRRL